MFFTMRSLFTSLSRNISRHWIAFLLGAVGAFIVFTPSLFSVFLIGQEYKGIPFLYQDSELRYLSRIHEVYDGHVALGSPMVYEYKDTSTPFAPTGEYVYVFLSKAFFLPLNSVVVLSKFLFPFLLFLLSYFFTYILSKDIRISAPRLTAIAAASVILLGYDFVDAGFIFDALKNHQSLFYLSIWTRLVNPITGAVLLFAFLLSLRSIMSGKAYAWLYAGTILGLMTGYIFSFSLAFATSVALVFLLVLSRRYDAGKRVAAAIFIGGCLNIFQFFQFIQSLFSSSGQEFTLRGGLFLTHVPLVSKVLFVSAIIWFAAMIARRLLQEHRDQRWKISDSEAIFYSLIVSALLVMNQHVVTGRTVWPQHFVQYTIPVSIIALIVSCARMVPPRFLVGWKIISTGIIAISFIFGLATIDSYKARENDFASRQRYRAAFDFFNMRAQKDCVVFSIEKEYLLSDMIPAFTHCNSYHTSFTFIGLPKERIVHNYFMWLRFKGLTESESDNYFNTHIGEYQRLLFDDWKELFSDMSDPWLTAISDRNMIEAKYKEMSPVLAKRYKEFLQNDFYADLKKYKLDFVIWDGERYPEWDPSRFPFLKEISEDSEVRIYAVVEAQ